jgi:hypothetical protein
MKYKPGDIIKWTSEYDDYIVKDSGTGIILDIKEYKLEEHSYVSYRVFRNAHNDIMFFEERDLHNINLKEK